MTTRITDDQWNDLFEIMVDFLRHATGREPSITSERRGNSLVLTVTLEPSEDDVLASAPEYVGNMAEVETSCRQAIDELGDQS